MSKSKQKLEMFQDQVMLEICRLLSVTQKQPAKTTTTVSTFFHNYHCVLKVIKAISGQKPCHVSVPGFEPATSCLLMYVASVHQCICKMYPQYPWLYKCESY